MRCAIRGTNEPWRLILYNAEDVLADERILARYRLIDTLVRRVVKKEFAGGKARWSHLTPCVLRSETP